MFTLFCDERTFEEKRRKEGLSFKDEIFSPKSIFG
jgi:hypothetical protein